MSRVLPTVTSLLAANGLSVSDVAEVIVGRGPGSFTGVRIGVATAKGLAHGLGVPLYGVGTLDAIAWGFVGQEALLAVAGDAMRGEVYPALFDCGGQRVARRSPDGVAKPADVVGEWAALDCPVLLAGNGLRKYGSLFAEALGTRATFAPEERWPPSALGLLRAYVRETEVGERGDGEPGAVLPIYTRLSDAEEAEATRRSTSEPGKMLPESGVAGEGPR